MSSAVIPNTRLTHGTIECADTMTSRRFFENFLGLGSVRPSTSAQYLWNGGPWSLVCVGIGGEPAHQTSENRFCLRVASPADVEVAHAAAHRETATYGIREIHPIVECDGHRSFLLKDLNGNWWEITSRTALYYDDLFARGDVGS
jgi:catechol 2,3-dioxygenase-like lactoylglutathione lyase family enzyme